MTNYTPPCGAIEKRLEEHLDWLYSRRFDGAFSVLSGLDFSDRNLDKARFNCARLDNACFSGAWLQYADFSHADISNTDFSGANLKGAKFKGAYYHFCQEPIGLPAKILNNLNCIIKKD